MRLRTIHHILIAAVALAAAAGARDVRAQAPAGVLVVGQVAEPRGLDPHTVTALNDFRILVNIYDGLVRFRDGTLEVEPALAESWHVSADGLEYTFTLRPNVRFHDGAPFDADAVKFNIERMLRDDHPFHDTGPFPLAFMLEAITQVIVMDPHTVRFVLEEPYAPLLSNLAYPIGLMVSPKSVREYGRDVSRHPAGTGAFRFDTWESRRRVVLTRNDDYWDGPPALDAVVFRPVADPVTRVSELMAGGVDMVVEAPADQVAALRSDAQFTVHEQSGPHLWFLILNTREGPLGDVRVRRALNYAVDKEAICDDLLQGTASVAHGPVPEAFEWAYAPDAETYTHDPERARALLEEAGVEDGTELTFYVTQGGSGMLSPVQMATAIQADLAAVGLDATIETYEWNTFLARVNDGLGSDADMAEMAWMVNDPHTLLQLALHSEALPENGGFNSGYYENPRVDAWIDSARVATDIAVRAELYKKIQREVVDDAPWLFVASWRQNAITSARVSGFSLQPSFFLDLHETVKE